MGLVQGTQSWVMPFHNYLSLFFPLFFKALAPFLFLEPVTWMQQIRAGNIVNCCSCWLLSPTYILYPSYFFSSGRRKLVSFFWSSETNFHLLTNGEGSLRAWINQTEIEKMDRVIHLLATRTNLGMFSGMVISWGVLYWTEDPRVGGPGN